MLASNSRCLQMHKSRFTIVVCVNGGAIVESTIRVLCTARADQALSSANQKSLAGLYLDFTSISISASRKTSVNL